MLSTVLVLVRHAHTAGNSPGEDTPLTGWADLPLSETGYLQSRRLRPRLAAMPVSAVYSSSSRRALETARTALPAGFPELHVRDHLREIHCGNLEGVPIGLVKRHHPELWARNEAQCDPQFGWPGGERYDQFRSRCLAALDDIVQQNQGGRVLVFTHAGFISQVVGAIRGISPARWGCFRSENSSLTEIAAPPQQLALLTFNDCVHLVAARGSGRVAS